MSASPTEVVLHRLVEQGLGLVQPVQSGEGIGHIGISAGAAGVQLHRLLSVIERVGELPQAAIHAGQIVVGGPVARISLLIEFEGGDSFVELAGVGVGVRHDIGLFVLAGALAQLEGFLPWLLRGRDRLLWLRR